MYWLAAEATRLRRLPITAKVAVRGMNSKGFDRRAILANGAGLGARTGSSARYRGGGPGLGRGGRGGPAADKPAADPKTFSPETVKALARKLSDERLRQTVDRTAGAVQQASYDQYRDIRFKTEQAIWRGDKLDFELQLFPMGWLYDMPVEIWLVEEGDARKLDGRRASCSRSGPLIGHGPEEAPFGFSGFRIHGPDQPCRLFRRVRRLPGRELFARRRPRPELWRIRARPCASTPRGRAARSSRSSAPSGSRSRSRATPGIVVHALLDSPVR